jgi:hypothetical protein
MATINPEDLRKRHIWLMKTTVITIGHVIHALTQQDATQLRDGEHGWTILEVICHLRDFDGFFRHRATMMLEQDNPNLPAYDHEKLAVERHYNGGNLQQAYAELLASRQMTTDFFKQLTAEQWERAGIHPERGHFTMLDAAIQVGLHDIDHLEQITRILREGVRA